VNSDTQLKLTSEISVILCTFNGEKYIYQQMHSIISGTLVPDTIYIFDWGSTDSTLEIIEQFCDTFYYVKIILIKRRAPIGPYNSFLNAFEQTLELNKNANYFLLCDQDDVWMEDKVEKMSNALKGKHTYDLIFSNAQYMSDNGYLNEHFSEENNFVVKNNTITFDASILFANPIIGMTMMVSRRLLSHTIEKQFFKLVDMHDWLVVLQCYINGYSIRYIPECLVQYRIHSNNIIGIQNGKFNLRKLFRYFEILKNIHERLVGLGKEHYSLEKNFREIIYSSNFFSGRFKMKLWIMMLFIRIIKMRNNQILANIQKLRR
jgi:glycosyltransferase involved in cell wall biosynthesis